MIDADVLIIGAGPAGSTAALNLAPTRPVVMVERLLDIPPRIGECLVPAARRLLGDMGLMSSFAAEPHAACYGNRSVWGSPEPVETDFLRDPDGHGWHLDRARFDGWLRDTALRRGARLIAPARIRAIKRSDGVWQSLIATKGGDILVKARFIIDAGGRAGAVARSLGARRHVHDRLICGWMHGETSLPGDAGFTYVEATADGWWYTAPLPGERRVLAFHTDADLLCAAVARNRNAMVERIASIPGLCALLSSTGFKPDRRIGFTSAHSALLDPCVGPAWLAAGDAALCFDPLSSQSIFNALFGGLAAAEAADRYLFGAADALVGYARTMADIWHAYRERLAAWYGMETRWPNAPFWQRRLKTAPGLAMPRDAGFAGSTIERPPA